MIRDLISEIAATTWREWLADLGQLVGVVVIVSAIALICFGLAPDLPQP
jgi:hypothetical protein